MDDFSLRFSGTCLKFCLFLRLASQYVSQKLQLYISGVQVEGGRCGFGPPGRKRSGNHRGAEVSRGSGDAGLITVHRRVPQHNCPPFERLHYTQQSKHKHIFFPGVY